MSIMDLKKIEYGSVDWFNSAADRNQRRDVVNTEITLMVP
jgi:hypothetical protein